MRKLASWVRPMALAGLLLSACQTAPVGQARRMQLQNSLLAFQQALNARSFEALNPLLAPEVRVDGLPGELSRAGLQAGMQWSPHRIEEVRVYLLKKIADGVEAQVALVTAKGAILMRIGFDGRGKIRAIDAVPQAKPSGAKVPAMFTSRFVVSGGLLFVRATVNDRTGFFLFDTGSSHLLLNRKYFSADTEPAMTGLSSTIHGLKKPGGLVKVRSLRWEGLRAYDLYGELHDFSEMEKAAITPLLGAISHAEVKNCAVAFDGKRRVIQVVPSSKGIRRVPPGAPPSAVIPFSYFLHLPLVTGRIGSREFPLLFDSGAEVNLLPSLDGVGDHFRPLGKLAGFSDGGAPKVVSAATGMVDRLYLGAAEYRGMPFVIHPVPYFPDKGLLGAPILEQSRVEIDFPARKILIWQ